MTITPRNPKTYKACIHSLNGELDTVTILEHVDNNHVTALYKGKLCTAVFNPFVGYYYVDDVYGIIQTGDDAQ